MIAKTKSMLSRLMVCFIILPALAGLCTACFAHTGGIAVGNPQQVNHQPIVDNSTGVSGTTATPSVENSQTNQAGKSEVGILLRAEEYDRAIENGTAALAASPSDGRLKQNLADAYIERAWFYKSKRLNAYTLTDLLKAVGIASDYYRAHYEIGRFHNNQWQFSIGLLDLNKALSLKPDFAPAYAERAYSYYRNQKLEQALNDADKAVELDPSDPRSYCVRSQVYLVDGKPDLALADANKAIQIAPTDAPSYYNRSLIYAASLRTDLAMADLETTLRFSQDDLLTSRANADLQKLKK